MANNRPISEKAYEGFRQRIIEVTRVFGHDPVDMLTMLDDYLSEGRYGGRGCSVTDRCAFEVIKYEIDRARERSARARARARMRRERKLAEQRERAYMQRLEAEQRAAETPLPDKIEADVPAEGTSAECVSVENVSDVSVLQVDERHDVARTNLYGDEQYSRKRYGLKDDGRCHESTFHRRSDARRQDVHHISDDDGENDGEIALDKLRCY